MIIGDIYFSFNKLLVSLSPLSFIYIFFLFSLFLFNYFAPTKIRYFLFLLADCLFIFSFASYHLIALLILTLVTYLWGLLINKYHHFIILSFSIISYILFLIIYKYGSSLGINWLMPLGFSFVSFKAISYLIDIYNNKYEADKTLLFISNYLLFFPTLIAGPINRYLPFKLALTQKQDFSYLHAKNGAFELFLGLFEKIVFCDFIASLIMRLSIVELSGYNTLLAIILYSVQIYLDFDAYSHIAIGSARLLGFVLPKNFACPYLSTSLSEFWRRWHISLGAFFKDYLYIPLGGSKHGKVRMYIAILIIFVLSGLWHGDTLNFFLWGLAHGLIMICEKMFAHIFSYTNNYFKWFLRILNFLIVTILWQLFKYASLKELSANIFKVLTFAKLNLKVANIAINEMVWLIFILIIVVVLDILRDKNDLLALYSKLPTIVRWFGYSLLVVIFLIFGVYGKGAEASDFIYRFF